jgi:hypothetical protein
MVDEFVHSGQTGFEEVNLPTVDKFAGRSLLAHKSQTPGREAPIPVLGFVQATSFLPRSILPRGTVPTLRIVLGLRYA